MSKGSRATPSPTELQAGAPRWKNPENSVRLELKVMAVHPYITGWKVPLGGEVPRALESQSWCFHMESFRKSKEFPCNLT